MNVFADPRPKVQLPGDDRLLSDFASELGRHLAAADIFTRSQMLVRVNERGDGLREVSADELRTWIEQHIVCFKLRRTGETETIQVARTMTTTDAAGVIASPQLHAKLRPIERVNAVRMPVRRMDQWIELLPEGYDHQSATLTLPNSPTVIEIPFDQAKQILNDLLAEFAFADDSRSRAVTVAAMLSVYAFAILPRHSLRPCFIYLANAEGAGKTLLVKLATVPVLGHAPTGCKPRDEDEMRKVLLAAVLEAKSVILFDNFRGRLASESLEGFLSSQQWTGRMLGGNRSFTGQNNVTVFLTGNGCTVSPDMRRRSLFCELFLEVERAEDRVFKSPLEVPQLLERRSEILSALWAFILNWHKSGEPSPSRGHSSFPDWAGAIAGITEFSGFGCPVETAQIEAAADVDGADMRTLVTILCNGSLMRSLKFDEVIDAAREGGLFERFVPSIDDMDSRAKTAFGKLLKTYDRRLIGGFRFTVEGKGHSRHFQVAKTAE